jgi:acetylornithine deacetylase
MPLVARLAELVSFDTQNPTGDERPLLNKLAGDLKALGATAVDVEEVGDRHGYVYAVFGSSAPKLLLNAHVDTVPANSGYSAPPHQLVERGGRLHGLGSADTKGAIAVWLEVLATLQARGEKPARPIGVLFSGDEEKGGTCLRAFLDSRHARGLERAIVNEPTGCRVGVRHRGIGAAEAGAVGPGGHSSLVDGLANPIAILARAAVALDEMGLAARDHGPPGFPGLCVNVAAIHGGIAFNVIPTSGTLMFSVRPGPGVSVAAVLADAERRVRQAAAPHPITWKVAADRPAFATRDLAGFTPLLGGRTAGAVDLGFWTEAAVLSEHGIDAVVFGPGEVGQAHAADEYVSLDDLQAARAAFTDVLS